MEGDASAADSSSDIYHAYTIGISGCITFVYDPCQYVLYENLLSVRTIVTIVLLGVAGCLLTGLKRLKSIIQSSPQMALYKGNFSYGEGGFTPGGVFKFIILFYHLGGLRSMLLIVYETFCIHRTKNLA